jgi:molecular chaperone Hsp33
MSNESTLKTYIDHERLHSLNILDGEVITRDISILHLGIDGEGAEFFKDTVLTGLHLISFLKGNETLGLYIDSDEPNFMFKIEVNDQGLFRTLMMPENFSTFPKTLTGKCRHTKIQGKPPRPYTSVIELENINFHEVMNQLLRDSYQVQATIKRVTKLDTTSYMIMRLPGLHPDLEINAAAHKPIDLAPLSAKVEQALLADDQETALKDIGFQFLRSRTIKFSCSCSMEAMQAGIVKLVHGQGIDFVFGADKSIETRCDYCKTFYLIERDEVERKSKSH